MLPRPYQHEHLVSATLAVCLGFFCCAGLNMCVSNCILPLIHCFLSLSQSPAPPSLYIIIFYSFSKINLNFTMKLFWITPEKWFVPLLNAFMTQFGWIYIYIIFWYIYIFIYIDIFWYFIYINYIYIIYIKCIYIYIYIYIYIIFASIICLEII